MDRLDERTARIFEEHERIFLSPPEEDDDIYCDWCGEVIDGVYYHVHNQNYCASCIEYFERDTND